jgi:hypothetical protein
MSFKARIYPPAMVLGVSIATLSVGFLGTATAHAQNFAWCTEGENLQCYYMNREQCEETVDYRGFCVPNPDFHQNRT